MPQQNDYLFFIGIFVFVFLLWIVLGGPNRPLSFSGPLLPNPDAIGGGTYLSFPRAPSTGTSGIKGSSASGGSSGSGSSSSGGWSGGSSSSGGLSYRDQQAVNNAIKSAAFGTPSKFRGAVTLSHRVTSPGNTNPQKEYLQLSVSNNAEGPISISGWSVVSEVTGKGGTLPRGTEVPRSGVINAVEPILLHPGDKAIIASGRSPIGASFRENVCIGYFAQFQSFTPTLPNSCPTPESELEKYYGPNLVRDPSCIDYVDRLSRCTLALSPPPTLSSSCQSFLTTHLNYNGCLTAHERDTNFKRTSWRIYLGRDAAIWRKDREVVKLLDADGKTVDMFSY